MRKCLFGWCYGSYNFRTKLSGRQIELLSTMVENCNLTKPTEIHRAIRGFKFLKFWKGSEYRTFLLYLGAVVLQDFLAIDVYEHFLMLLSAVTILSCEYYKKYLNIADALLKEYIELYIDIYGIDSISSNVHNLCHVVDDVRKFGSLPEISSYAFENYLGYIKSLLRSGNRPLAQISRRIIELSYVTNTPNTKFVIKLNDEILNFKNMYNSIHMAEDFILSNNAKNKWFLTNSLEVVSMKYATRIKGQFNIHGNLIKNTSDFFKKPLRSSNLHIYALPLKIYTLSDIKCKIFCLKYRNELIFFPLIHALDYMVEYLKNN